MSRAEVAEIRRRYKRREQRDAELYNLLIPFESRAFTERFYAITRLIRWARLEPVSKRTVLEIGCGKGGNLLQLLLLGFLPENLVGNELLEDQAAIARTLLPTSTRIIVGNAAELDLGGTTFDIVYQSTVFTSILDYSFQQELANRLWALTKPGGGIIWYDFVFNNPRNPDVRGITTKKIRRLFPMGNLKVWRVTLAPPLGRLVTRISPHFYSLFNCIPFLRSHVLCWIAKDY